MITENGEETHKKLILILWMGSRCFKNDTIFALLGKCWFPKYEANQLTPKTKKNVYSGYVLKNLAKTWLIMRNIFKSYLKAKQIMQFHLNLKNRNKHAGVSHQTFFHHKTTHLFWAHCSSKQTARQNNGGCDGVHQEERGGESGSAATYIAWIGERG